MATSGARSQADDEVFEFIPEDVSAEQAAAVGQSNPSEFEVLGSLSFEPGSVEAPEQRLARLQAEVADLLELTAFACGDADPAETLGADPETMARELKELENRLACLAKDGPAAWAVLPGPSAARGQHIMAPSLVAQLQQLSSSPPTAAHSSQLVKRVTYDLSYASSSSSLADGSKLAALERSLAAIEKRLGTLDTTCPYTDLEAVTAQMQQKLTVLDGKIDVRKMQAVKIEVEELLRRKQEMQGTGNDGLDQKVNELYDLCHKWSTSSAALPAIIARLRALQALHQQSGSFAGRLADLDDQQQELLRVLETTRASVRELGKTMQENLAAIREMMTGMEAKMKQLEQ